MANSAAPQSDSGKPVPTWRKVLAAIFDFVSILFVGGYAIGYLTGNLTEEGFNLQGGPALLLFAVIALYFVVFSRFLGGTPWQRVLRVR